MVELVGKATDQNGLNYVDEVERRARVAAEVIVKELRCGTEISDAFISQSIGQAGLGPQHKRMVMRLVHSWQDHEIVFT